MPTPKSQAIDDLLTDIAGISRQDAATQLICTWCKQPFGTFRDALSVREHEISGMCQACQDKTFTDPDEGGQG